MAGIIEQLKSLRIARNLKQSELGEKLGLPQSHLSKIEQENTDPRLSTVTDIARALDHELVLVPRQLIPQIQALTHGEDKRERRFGPDEDEV